MPKENANVAEIVSKPEAYGFSWYTDKVQKGDLGPWEVPLVKHNDVDLLRATFGDSFFLASADGTSRHVTNQRIARDMKADKPLTTADAIKTAIVENMLGMKSKRRTVVLQDQYKYNGVAYKTAEEMADAARKDLTEQGYPADLVETFVSRLIGSTVEK